METESRLFSTIERVGQATLKAASLLWDVILFLAFLFEMLVLWLHHHVAVDLYIKSLPVVRDLLGIRIAVSGRGAIRIAEDEAGYKSAYTLIGQRLWSWDIYIEKNPSYPEGDDCRATKVFVDMRDGHIISSQEVPCLHLHSGI